jgi:hypothetical protein
MREGRPTTGGRALPGCASARTRYFLHGNGRPQASIVSVVTKNRIIARRCDLSHSQTCFVGRGYRCETPIPNVRRTVERGRCVCHTQRPFFVASPQGHPRVCDETISDGAALCGCGMLIPLIRVSIISADRRDRWTVCTAVPFLTSDDGSTLRPLATEVGSHWSDSC